MFVQDRIQDRKYCKLTHSVFPAGAKFCVKMFSDRTEN